MADGAVVGSDPGVNEKGSPLVERLKLALELAYFELCEVEQFAGTTEVLRPIVRGQQVCRWEDPGWPELMAEIEVEIAQAKAVGVEEGKP